MNNSSKAIAVIGEQAIVKIFNALGYDCFALPRSSRYSFCCAPDGARAERAAALFKAFFCAAPFGA